MATTQVIIETYTQSVTGLPKDRFINVWHFLDVTGASPGDVATTACQKIADFFATPPSGGGIGPVEHVLAASQDDTIQMVAYDFAAAKPRPELGRATRVYAPHNAQNLPEELALCLSYYTDRNLKSHRGRLYIGPFNADALSSSGAPPRPNTNLTAAMQDGGTRLIILGPPAAGDLLTTNTIPTTGDSASCAWALFSPKLNTFAAIEHGWIDDEWDGQSRRRVEASTRFTY